MADLTASFNFTMKFEDSTLSGVVTPDPAIDDPEAISRFGINSASHPDALADGFFKMDRDKALEYAAIDFKIEYFAAMSGYLIGDQDICNKVVDLAYNTGEREATKIVQRALNAVIAGPVAIDGAFGQQTLDSVNAAEPIALLAAIKDKAKDFYIALAAAHPNDEKFLESWLKRVDA